jgi:hypothetical protein
MNFGRHFDKSNLLNWAIFPSKNYEPRTVLQNEPAQRASRRSPVSSDEDGRNYQTNPFSFTKICAICEICGCDFAKQSQISSFSIENRRFLGKQTQIKPISWVPGFLRSWVLLLSFYETKPNRDTTAIKYQTNPNDRLNLSSRTPIRDPVLQNEPKVDKASRFVSFPFACSGFLNFDICSLI